MSDVSDEIERKAQEAQAMRPGPWRIAWTDDRRSTPAAECGIDHIVDANGEEVVVADSGVYPPHGPVAEHIAGCSPDVVIAMVARQRELESWLRYALEHWAPGGSGKAESVRKLLGDPSG